MYLYTKMKTAHTTAREKQKSLLLYNSIYHIHKDSGESERELQDNTRDNTREGRYHEHHQYHITITIITAIISIFTDTTPV